MVVSAVTELHSLVRIVLLVLYIFVSHGARGGGIESGEAFSVILFRFVELFCWLF